MLLVSPDRLRMCMERTGDGRPISVRALAEVAGVHPSKIDALLNGRRSTAAEGEAKAIATRCGVDWPFLWDQSGRATPAPQEPEDELATAVTA